MPPRWNERDGMGRVERKHQRHIQTKNNKNKTGEGEREKSLTKVTGVDTEKNSWGIWFMLKTKNCEDNSTYLQGAQRERKGR